jgi:phage gp36-like protein
MYCTISDLKTVIPEQDMIELTDDMVPAAKIIAANVNKAIADAGELIDGYLRGHYRLPLSPVPGIISTLACDIAVYRLYARKSRITPPEGVSDRYKNALALLAKMQSGDIMLGAGGDISTESDTDRVGATAGDRIFTRQTMKGF